MNALYKNPLSAYDMAARVKTIKLASCAAAMGTEVIVKQSVGKVGQQDRTHPVNKIKNNGGTSDEVNRFNSRCKGEGIFCTNVKGFEAGTEIFSEAPCSATQSLGSATNSQGLVITCGNPHCLCIIPAVGTQVFCLIIWMPFYLINNEYANHCSSTRRGNCGLLSILNCFVALFSVHLDNVLFFYI